jgi:RimJ/RimL family protein N-acetyltransferase
VQFPRKARPARAFLFGNGYNLRVTVQPVKLDGQFVSMEPLSLAHVSELCEVGLEPELWKWTISVVGDQQAMMSYVESALADQSRGLAIPFVTRDKHSNKIVGSTRFGNIDVPNRKVEIGWTWVSPEWQRSYVNTEAKLLMLTHAFEVWSCVRVEFKTDALNAKSRAALSRLGAKEEGTLRNHMITETGRFRDSVYFSIIEGEWPKVKADLRSKLAR